MRIAGALRKVRGVDLLVRSIALLLILFPAALAFLYVRLFGVDIPFGDAWTTVSRFDKLSLGTLSFQDLWVQHFEHRMFFPRSAQLLLGLFTEWNNVVTMYFTQACFLATAVILFMAFKRSVGWRLLFFVPIPFLVFNLAQYFNMLFAFQIALAFAQMFGVLALYLLYISEREGFKKFAFPAALASGVVASFSLGSGLFVWPAGFLQLVINPIEKRTKGLLLGIWSLVGIGAWVSYFIGLTVPQRQTGSFIFENPTLGVRFFLTTIGNPFAWWPSLPITGAFISGLLLSCLIVISLLFVYRSGKLGEHSFWIGLLAFGLLCSLSIVAARTGLGIEAALTSRYITFTVLVAISVYMILIKLALERSSRAVTASLGVILLLFAAGLPFSYVHGIEMGEKFERKLEEDATILSTYSSQPYESLDLVNRQPEDIKENAFVLCKLGYSVFSDPEVRKQNCLPPPRSSLSLVSSSSPTPYEIETIAGREVDRRDPPIVVSGKKSSVRVAGWAVDANNEKPAGGVYIKIDGRLFPALYGRSLYPGPDKNETKRFSVPPRLGAQSYEFSGFEQSIPLSEIGTGKHKMSLVVVTNDRERYYRPNQKVTFEVR